MEFYLSFPPRRSILRRNISVHCATSSSPWVHLSTKEQQHLAFNRATENGTVKTQPRIEYIFAVLPFIGASTFELIVGLVRRHRKENAMAWNFSWSVFPSNSFATLGSIAFRTRITARLARCRNRKTFDQILEKGKSPAALLSKREIFHQSGCPKWRGPFILLTELVTRVVELKISTNQNATLGISWPWQTESN